MTAADPVWRDLTARTFVPVEGLTRTAPPIDAPPEFHAPPPINAAPPIDAPPGPTLDLPLAAVDPLDSWDGRISLFGDAEH